VEAIGGGFMIMVSSTITRLPIAVKRILFSLPQNRPYMVP
jgi:hypothetical protein